MLQSLLTGQLKEKPTYTGFGVFIVHSSMRKGKSQGRDRGGVIHQRYARHSPSRRTVCRRIGGPDGSYHVGAVRRAVVQARRCCGGGGTSAGAGKCGGLKGLSHEIDFKNFVKNLQNLVQLRDAAGF